MTVANNATLTVTGTIWVEGTISTGNPDSAIRLSSNYGSNSGLIIGDDTILINNGGTVAGSGDPASYIMVVATKDDPNGEVMTVDNGSLGAVYYAGKGRIRFANGAAAKEATAYGITLSNTAAITYETGLANLSFTSGPGGGWVLEKGSLQEF